MMLVTNQQLLDRYDLHSEQFAMIIDANMTIHWASSALKQLDFMDEQERFKLHPQSLTTWQNFIIEILLHGKSKCIVLTNTIDIDNVFYLNGEFDMKEKLFILKIKLPSINKIPSKQSAMQLINYLQHGIIITSTNHSILHFNQNAQKMIPKQSLCIGKSVYSIINEYVGYEDCTVFFEELAQVGNAQRIYSLQGCYIQMIASFDERLQSYLYIFEDITKEIQLQENLQQQNYLSEIGKMTTMIVHEMRNPMTSIKGCFDLIRMGNDSSGKYMEIIESELNRLDQLCTDILCLSKPSQGLVKDVDLLNIAQEIKQIMEVEAQQKNIQLLLVFNQKERFIVPGNEVYFKQVFINIVKNAIQASNTGGTITMHLIESIHNVQIHIIDSGVGINQQSLETIFDMFYTTKDYGTGLGLPLVKKIVEQFNGQVNVESIPGVGTTFSVSFPTIH